MISQSSRRNGAVISLVLWAAMAPVALAHGLLISVRGEGAQVTGKIYYSNGQAGAGEWVQLFDLTEPGAKPLAMASSPDGSFRFAGAAGHRYRVTASGDEGHVVDSEITLAPGARGRFVERQSDVAAIGGGGFKAPPAWALLGGLLALSMIPALWWRSRSQASPPVSN